MELILPDMLEAGRGIDGRLPSVSPCVTILTFGFALWLFGWRWHRFWIVMGATLAAGMAGLVVAQRYEIHPLVCALVLAVIAGLLSLALVRVVAFVAGGGTALMLVQTLSPAWEQPIISFIIGGLLGVFLLRLWLTALTSLLGTLLMVYSTLCLLDRLNKLDAVTWSGKYPVLLNWVTIGVAVVGLVVQLLIERRRTLRQREAEKKTKEKEKDKKEPPPRKPWWTLGLPMYRQAG